MLKRWCERTELKKKKKSILQFILPCVYLLGVVTESFHLNCVCLTPWKSGVSALGFKLLVKFLAFFTSITSVIPGCTLRGDTGSRLHLQALSRSRSSTAQRTVSEWTSPPCTWEQAGRLGSAAACASLTQDPDPAGRCSSCGSATRHTTQKAPGRRGGARGGDRVDPAPRPNQALHGCGC